MENVVAQKLYYNRQRGKGIKETLFGEKGYEIEKIASIRRGQECGLEVSEIAKRVNIPVEEIKGIISVMQEVKATIIRRGEKLNIEDSVISELVGMPEDEVARLRAEAREREGE